jgi:hypothetical protein
MHDELQRELHRLEATLAGADAAKTRVIDELSNMRQELSCESDPSAPFYRRTDGTVTLSTWGAGHPS